MSGIRFLYLIQDKFYSLVARNELTTCKVYPLVRAQGFDLCKRRPSLNEPNIESNTKADAL